MRGMKPVVTLEGLGNILLLEDHYGIEEGKGHDQHEIEQPVCPAVGAVRVEGVGKELSDGGDDPDAAADEVAGDCARENQHARGKDERDHTCRVHLEWDVGGATAEDAVTANLLGYLDGNAALALIDVDDGYDGDQAQGAEHQHRTDVQTGGEALQDLVGQAGDDAAKDDDRHALPDSVLRDQLTHPHQQHRA